MTTPPERPSRRRVVLIVLAALGLLALLAAGGAYLYVRANEPGDVNDPDVAFERNDPRPAAPRREAAFVWPDYGYTKDRNRYLPAPAALRPPFRTLWSLGTRDLVEFPPVIYQQRLYLLKNNGVLLAVGARNGRERWKRKLGALAAASPTVGGGVVYAVILKRLHRVRAGRVVALTARRGRTLWSRPLRARSESSPLLYRGRLYFGSEDGTIYALDARTGRIDWTFKAKGDVKAGLTLRRGVLYFGDYGGRVYAVSANSGRKVWTASTKGAQFGLSAGNFYSTPAVAFGRVYLGNTDGFVYSFSARDGKLAWSKRTGGYVYASPAVADLPRLGPTIYIGSYDGSFYAMDARNGKVRWRRKIGGKISGSATIVGNIVYFANLAKRTTIGLAARSGRPVFSFPRGGFNPVVSDGRRIYLVGYASLYGLAPR
ncbi:MAG TPA: PQQ-binding-like beta-propeller repeat protein [Solirubrobacteraceae bacterium]|nr:PQQ-binding-like beta-propeller repeat protein [Solirubrobacteraceae bacterium]